MQKVSEYENRSTLAKKLNEKVPIYVLLEDWELLEVHHVSKNYFRDCAPTENENGGLIFDPDCWKQRIRTNDIIFENKKEAEKYKNLMTAKKIMTEFDKLEEKYFKWKKFKEDNPQYFI
jgi:hypothetical protein